MREYLSFSVKSDSLDEITENIAECYESLGVMASASHGELARIPKVSDNTALSIKLLGYLYSRSITDDFKFGRKHTEEEISEYFAALFTGLAIETVYCMTLDGKGRILSCEHMGDGTVNSSEIYPRRILEYAAKCHATGVIIAHNHPKGKPVTSNEDRFATECIKCILKDAGIELIAHYLVSDGECVKMDF